VVRNFGGFEFLSWGDFVWKNNDFNNWVSFRAELHDISYSNFRRAFNLFKLKLNRSHMMGRECNALGLYFDRL